MWRGARGPRGHHGRRTARGRGRRQPGGGPGRWAGRPTWWAWARASLVILALAGCREKGAPKAEAEPVILGPENAAVARIETIVTGPYVSGTLQPRQEAMLRSELAAQVVATYVEKGDAVDAGQLLARLESGALRDARRSAAQAVATAEQMVGFTAENVRRAEVLYAAGGVALRDVEAARVDLATAEAQLAEARSQLAAIDEQLSDTEIRTPFDGRIAARNVTAGDAVQPGMDLFTVIDPTTMRLEAEIPAEHLGAARIGTPARFRVRGYPAVTFRGTVERVGPAADSATRQIEIVISIPNATGALVANLFADGRIESEVRRALVIPEDAVDETGPGPSVLAVRQGRADRVDVVLGLRDEEMGKVEVTAGLFPGDTVLVGTARTITEGTPVVIRSRLPLR